MDERARIMSRTDLVTIGGYKFSVYWDDVTGRPGTFGIYPAQDIPVTVVQEFLRWCGEQPNLHGKK